MVKNQSHTLAYSLIALQEMNLAFKYPIIFWNCACLISDAGGSADIEEDEEAIEETKVEEPYYEEMEEFNDDEDEEVSSYDEDDGANGYPATIIVTKSGKKKKKLKTTNYGKVASAIGRIKASGVVVTAPDINESTYTFSPDVENNAIRYGMSGITRIGDELIKNILANRPYTSLDDFLSKIKLTKPQVINLIKSGAFDRFGDRVKLMHSYVESICGAKKVLNMRNMQMLIEFGFIPDEYDLQCRVFNFNKYIKKSQSADKKYYNFDNIAFEFYSKNFDVDLLVSADTESGFAITQTKWDSIYKKQMDIVRPFIQKNQQELLKKVNNKLCGDVWDKYCVGSISKWEMDSISCYIHEHELEYVDYMSYGIDDFYSLPETPEIERYIPIKGKQVPILKLHRIMGTVLDRDKNKKMVTLLTTGGVVTIKIYGGVFSEYDKQLSERRPDGTKHVIRKSEFSRGNKIIVIGVRDGANEFRGKKYSKTPFHLIETIKEVEDNRIIIDNRNDGEEL